MMRRPRTLLLALCVLPFFALPAPSHAQGTWEAMLNIQPFPSPYFSDWDQDPNIGSLTVVNHTTGAEAVRIFFTITDRMNRVIASGTSDPEIIGAGAVVIYDSPYQIAGSGSHDTEFERIAARTGRLPEGDYTACASAADAVGFVLAEACADFFIAYPDPPLLLAPENGMPVLDEAPLFQWTPVQVPLEYQLRYVVRIVEVLPGQLPGEALAANIPVYEDRDAFGTTLRYPIDARPLEPGSTYAWSVQAVDQNGYTASANDGRSEIWTFVAEDPSLPPVTASTMSVLLSPGSDPTAEPDDDAETLAGICLLWDNPPPTFIRVPMNVTAAFLANATQTNATLYRDRATRSWALLTERVGASESYLLFGECLTGSGGTGGLRWIARRAGSLNDLGLTVDGSDDSEEETDELPAHELGWRFGMLVLALHYGTVGKLPETFEAPSEFLGFREIKVKPGVNVYAEVDLGTGPARSVLEAFGHKDPYVALQGFVGVALKFSVGGHIGQAEPDTAGSRFQAKTQAEVEATILSLEASLPRREPLFLADWIDATQVAVKLDVKAKGDVGREWHTADGSWTPGLKVGAGLALSLAVQFAEDTWLGGVQPDGSAVMHTASVGFKKQLYQAGDTTSRLFSRDNLAAVIKVGSDRELDRFDPIIFNSPEVEVEIKLARPFPGLDGVKVKVGGQVGIAAAKDLGKGSLELSWPTSPAREGASGSQSRGDSIRANIARLEAQQKSALDRGATAEAESLGKQLDLERNALVSWELFASGEPADTSAAPTPGGRSLHWKLELALGNMGLSDVVQLIGQASRRNGSGFDPPSLEIPPGFLDLTDLMVTASAGGAIVATGTGVLGNASAHVLLAVDPARGIRDGLTLGIKPEAWSLTENIPALSGPVLDGVDFSNVGLVVASADRDEVAGQMSDQERAFYGEIYQTDDFRLTLRPGVNLVASIPAAELGADHPLTVVMDALGIEQGVILIQGGLGRSLGLLSGGGGANAIRDLYLRAELPPMRPPGSPEWFHGGQLALELTGDPSVRLVGEMTVAIDEDVLMFFVAAALARSGMSLAGGLVAEDGWQQPFGIPWLILNRVVLQLGITPTGSIQPGFAAGMVIGEKDIDVAVSMAISPAGVPTSFMFAGESEAGVGLSDLAEVQRGMAMARDAASGAFGGPEVPRIPLDALPDMDVRDMALKFAPQDAPELGVERGFRVAGQLWLPLSADGELTQFAGVDVSVSADGILASGELGAFELGPLVWHDAMLDLAATREAQHLLVTGGVELFGASQLVDLSLTREEFSFRSQTNLFDMFTADLTATSVFDLRRPDFHVHAIVGADFGDAMGPIAQDAIVLFAQQGGNVLATAAAANRAASDALAHTQATVDELIGVLEAQRAVAESALAVAEANARSRRSTMNRALTTRNRAWSTYRRTSTFPAWRKAQRRAEYARANASYRTAAVRYNAAEAVVSANRRVLNAIPPVSENILVMSANDALRELRAQLAAMQRALDEMERQLAAINEALERGEQLLAIDRAEFQGGLQSAMNGEAIRWDIVGRFVGEPFEVSQTMDFSNPGEGVAHMLRALIGI